MHKRKVGLTVEDLLEVVTSHVTVKETKSLLAELEDLWKRRTVYQTLLSALNQLQQDDKPTDQLIAEAQQAMIDAFAQTGRSEVKTMHEVAEKLFLRQERIQSGEQPAVYAFNLKGVQDLVGRLETGSLTIVAARPAWARQHLFCPSALDGRRRGCQG